VYLTRLQLGFSGQAGNASGFSTARLDKNEALADFLIDYGLPGRSGYHYERPFDYFSLQATLSSANGFENVMVRGLLEGHEYTAGERYRGVLGIYGTYDYIAPQTYQVSATGVALGTTGQYWASDKVAILGTSLLRSGYTAAGAIRSEAPSYHYGLAPYSLAALRFVFGEACALDLTAREYYVSHVAAATRGGHENIARLDAALTFRVKGRHGISIKYLGNRRDEYYPDAGDFSQHRGTVGLFYTYLGNDLFGAEALPRH